ncbi:MAG: radical SAM protein [Polyangiaceae bacterium]|nr:radical SAM protein [Polyangiaceae bacterium]
MVSERTFHTIRERLAAEQGRIEKVAPYRVALLYPSPYVVGMSSLGYQTIYRLLQGMDGVACERVFLPDRAAESGALLEVPVSYETLTPLGDFDLVAASVAYELELVGLVRLLDAARLGALRSDPSPGMPLVIAGGPLTFSNPLPLAPFVDAIVMGEGEGVLAAVIEHLRSAPDRRAALARLATAPHIFVPALGGDDLPPIAAADPGDLPAHSVIRTPHTELRDMFLVEPERGCSRGCTYCVMRRSTNGGMRILPVERTLEVVPPDARRVGLVGAAVSDHPRIVDLVDALADRGCEVGLSSLRPDKVRDPLVAALCRAGHRTLTTALDGASERLRGLVDRRGYERHYRAAAETARRHGMDRLKLYLMVGLPGESTEDLDECASFVTELSHTIPVALGIAPFCAKRNTPLDGAPFAGVGVVERRLARLRRGLGGRADIRAASARWAWVEHVLAQGGRAEGLALCAAVRSGGRFADFRRELARLGHHPDQPIPRANPGPPKSTWVDSAMAGSQGRARR